MKDRMLDNVLGELRSRWLPGHKNPVGKDTPLGPVIRYNDCPIQPARSDSIVDSMQIAGPESGIDNRLYLHRRQIGQLLDEANRSVLNHVVLGMVGIEARLYRSQNGQHVFTEWGLVTAWPKPEAVPVLETPVDFAPKAPEVWRSNPNPRPDPIRVTLIGGPEMRLDVRIYLPQATLETLLAKANASATQRVYLPAVGLKVSTWRKDRKHAPRGTPPHIYKTYTLIHSPSKPEA